MENNREAPKGAGKTRSEINFEQTKKQEHEKTL